jgi:hypothetical protein
MYIYVFVCMHIYVDVHCRLTPIVVDAHEVELPMSVQDSLRAYYERYYDL